MMRRCDEKQLRYRTLCYFDNYYIRLFSTQVHCIMKQGRILVEIVGEVEKYLEEVQRSSSKPQGKVTTGQNQHDVSM